MISANTAKNLYTSEVRKHEFDNRLNELEATSQPLWKAIEVFHDVQSGEWPTSRHHYHVRIAQLAVDLAGGAENMNGSQEDIEILLADLHDSWEPDQDGVLQARQSLHTVINGVGNQPQRNRVPANFELLKSYGTLENCDLPLRSPCKNLSSISQDEFVKTLWNPQMLKRTDNRFKDPGVIFLNRDFKDSVINNQRHTHTVYPTDTNIKDHLFTTTNLFINGDFATSREDPNFENLGRKSNNFANHCYILLEHDQGFTEYFSAFCIALSEHAPLVSAVDTGKKSVHFLFNARGLTTEQRQLFLSCAMLHGADPSANSNTQLSRLPDVEKDGRHQKLIYFNPDATKPDAIQKWDFDAISEMMMNEEVMDNIVSFEGKQYYMVVRDEWCKQSDKTIYTTLQEAGFTPRVTEDDPNGISPLKHMLKRLDQERLATKKLEKVAGYDKGYYPDDKLLICSRYDHGRYYLGKNVKVSDKDIQPIMNQLTMFGDQKDYILTWLQSRFSAMYNNGKPYADHSRRQTVYVQIVGEPDAGKSTFFDYIAAPLLGGKADASALFKSDRFTSSLAAYGLLTLDDSALFQRGHRQYCDASSQASIAKELVIRGIDKIEGKFENAVYGINPFQSLVRILNESDIDTLPDFKDADKYLILRVQKTYTTPETNLNRFFNSIKYALPYFGTWLLNDYKPPQKCVGARYGVASYIDPDIKREITEGYDVEKLMIFLSSGIVKINHNSEEDDLVFTRETLWEIMKENSAAMSNMSLTIPNSNDLGKLLTDTANFFPDNLEKDANRRWVKIDGKKLPKKRWYRFQISPEHVRTDLNDF